MNYRAASASVFLIRALIFFGTAWLLPNANSQVTTGSVSLPKNLDGLLYSYPNAFFTARASLAQLYAFDVHSVIQADLNRNEDISNQTLNIRWELLKARTALSRLDKYTKNLSKQQLNQTGESFVWVEANAESVSAIIVEGRKFFAVYKIPAQKAE